MSELLRRHRHAWRLPHTINKTRFLDFLLERGLLKATELKAPKYDRSTTRYVWGEPTPYALVITLSPRAYFSHATALGMLGLAPLNTALIYFNIEQSEKHNFAGEITQTGINNAFKRQQRQSQMVYTFGNAAAVQLAGKHSNNLGVTKIMGPGLQEFPVTDIERTLIDIVVRPAYAGGVVALYGAYKAAIGKISAKKLLSYLNTLNHAYPYKQAIGFLLESTGHDTALVQSFKQKTWDHKFYIDHAMQNPAFSEAWSLYYPNEFEFIGNQ